MIILTLKTAHHAKATARRAATARPVVNAASALNVQKATSVRMTVLKLVQKAAPKNATKAAIHAMNAGMTVAHVVTKQAKTR